jgi:serine/threonine-protein kinase HipA
MAKKSIGGILAVYLNARRVGTLEQASTGAISFSYSAEWLNWRHAIAVSRTLPLNDTIYRGAVVFNVFDNLLPDIDRVRLNLAARLRANGKDPFSLLAVAGRDCVGALQFLPLDEEPGLAGASDGEPLNEADIAALIRNLRLEPLGLTNDDRDFRISIAGAQDKTALLYANGRWLRPIGTAATTHILKPAIGILDNGMDLSDSVANEHICMSICTALGLPVAKTQILTFDDQTVLSVERFDRIWTDDGRLLRIPQEDLCQTLSVPSVLKYQRDGGPGILDIMSVLRESDTPDYDRATFLKAQMVFWLLGASDGHAKNYSIRLREGGRFNLTPLYDILSIQPLVDKGQISKNRSKLSMSVGDGGHYRFDIIARRHFDETAKAAGLSLNVLTQIVGELIDHVGPALDATRAELDDNILSQLFESIAQGMLTRLEILKLA